jgi:hypothetical protein
MSAVRVFGRQCLRRKPDIPILSQLLANFKKVRL